MISIYNYSNSINYLSDYFNFKQNTDANFSLTKWCKDAGFTSAATMISILKEKKELKINLAASIVDKIGLDPSEYVYFLALASKERSTNAELKKMYDLLLIDLKPSSQSNFNSARFSDGDLFSHWILTTILGATKLKNIELNPKNLKLILREEISEEIIEAGLDFLVENKLLTSKDGKLIKTFDQVSTVTDKKHPNVNNYFCQMADMVKNAVDVPLSQREFQSFNMPIPKENLPLAKEIIRKCRSNLTSLCTDNADEVYQMNMFLFPLTQSFQENRDI